MNNHVATSTLSTDSTIRHIDKYGGEQWYLNCDVATSGDGKSPDTSFKTFTEALTAMSNGEH